MLLLNPTPLARGLAGKKVAVVNDPDGRFAVRYEAVISTLHTLADLLIKNNAQVLV
jgi:hypothetical protein